MSTSRFPADFLWGTATSSYQIEGAARTDGRVPSIWDEFTRRPGAIWNGHNGDVATDHYHRLEEDLDLLAWLGARAYRFSVAWPRVLPTEDGRPNPRGLDFYRRLVDGLLERDIAPVLTLYHWDLPQAFQELGGWAARGTVDRFVEYTAAVADALGDRVGLWATLNEPWCSAFLGYRVGKHAPGIRDDQQAVAACHHLLLAHGRATALLRERLGPHGEVGIALNLAPVRPAFDVPEDHEAARIVDGGRNRVWLDTILRGHYPADVLDDWERLGDLSHIRDGDLAEIAAPIDWLGINYYHPITVTRGDGDGVEPGSGGIVQAPPAGPRTAMGWPIDACGLTEIVDRVVRDYGAIDMLVTENGAAFDDLTVSPDGQVDDADRVAFLADHIDEVATLVGRGARIRGYFLWSLLDNFEWAEGYRRRFGIVAVDPETQVRIPKTSATWYRGVIATGGDTRRATT